MHSFLFSNIKQSNTILPSTNAPEYPGASVLTLYSANFVGDGAAIG